MHKQFRTIVEENPIIAAVKDEKHLENAVKWKN